MEPTDGASVSNRFDAFLGELDGLTPTTEKQIEKRLRAVSYTHLTLPTTD